MSNIIPKGNIEKHDFIRHSESNYISEKDEFSSDSN
jgi:hypothetical protein